MPVLTTSTSIHEYVKALHLTESTINILPIKDTLR